MRNQRQAGLPWLVKRQWAAWISWGLSSQIKAQLLSQHSQKLGAIYWGKAQMIKSNRIPGTGYRILCPDQFRTLVRSVWTRGSKK